MKKITLILLLFCCLCSNLFAQNTGKNEPLVLQTAPATLVATEKMAIDTVFSKYELLAIQIAPLKALLRTLQGEKTATVVLDLPALPRMTIEFKANDLRSPNFVGSINGRQENLPIEMRECITFRGTVKEDQTAEILLTITDSFLLCNFTFANQAYTIEPCSNYKTTGKEFVFYANTAKIYKEGAARCGNTESEADHLKEKITSPITTQKLQGGCRIAEIALDGDFYFSEQYKQNAYGMMMGTCYSVSGIYKRDLNIQLLIVYTNIFTVHKECPYSAGDPKAGIFVAAFTYLSRATDAWRNSTLARDVVHVFSGRKFAGGGFGGLANTGTACGNTAVCFTSTEAAFGAVNTTMAHEVGHVMGGEHQGCSFLGIFGNDTIMCPGADSPSARFSNGSKEEIGNFINFHIACFDNITGLGDKIEGPDFICDANPVQVYTLAVPRNLSVYNPFFPALVWTSTGNITIREKFSFDPNEPNSILEVTKIGDGIGSITANYTIPGVDCPVQVFTKSFRLGKPTAYELRTEDFTQNCRDVSSIIYINGAENSTEFRWEYLDPFTRAWTFFELTPYTSVFMPNLFTIPNFQNWYRNSPREACINIAFRMTPANQCGMNTDVHASTMAYITFCKSGGNMYCRQTQTTPATLNLSVHPNPAETEFVTIEVQDSNYEVVGNQGSYTITICNSMGQVVKVLETKQLETKVALQDLPTGLYIVKVAYKNELLTQKLVVQK